MEYFNVVPVSIRRLTLLMFFREGQIFSCRLTFQFSSVRLVVAFYTMSHEIDQWDLSRAVIRDESQLFDCDTESSLGSDSSLPWVWPSEQFHFDRPLIFDYPDVSFKSFDQPASPSSSIDTTPTSSELPLPLARHHSHIDDSLVSSPKRRRLVVSHSTSSLSEKHGRKKKYDAPPGVWRNSGGFISTVYINKKRVYGPLRRDVNDAVRDREEMLEAKNHIHTEDGMRSFVQGMKERCGKASLPMGGGSPASTPRPARSAPKRDFSDFLLEDGIDSEYEIDRF
jgi:hypothetical protein